MGKRNSYSKTDPDATFMRMKDDPMKNGQLKPGYNLQISTENQFIINFSLHQRAGDTTTYPEHINQIKDGLGIKPEKAVTDSGYGSEENYEFLEKNEIEAYLKYNYFHKELKEKPEKRSPFNVRNLFYNISENCYYCPMGQKMSFLGTKKKRTDNGYEQTLSIYQAQRCEGCPLRGQCHKARGNRKIEVNHKLNEYRNQAKERLTSEEGIKHRKQRCADVEATFGQMKSNKGFDRFLCADMDKVNVEMGLVCLAMNIQKLFRVDNVA